MYSSEYSCELLYVAGDWLCLKNLHLMSAWLPALEKELNALAASGAHESFRLFLTAEPHARFSSIVLQSSLKITYEAPPGVLYSSVRTPDV